MKINRITPEIRIKIMSKNTNISWWLRKKWKEGRGERKREKQIPCVSNGLYEDLGDNNGKIDYKC